MIFFFVPAFLNAIVITFVSFLFNGCREHVHKMLEGAQKNPTLVVPRLIERLRSKDNEWREAQAGFNRVWREQTEKYYGKSLDHQALTFKQNDLKLLRSKMIIHNFETLYDEVFSFSLGYICLLTSILRMC